MGKLFVAAASGGVGALIMITQEPYRTELWSIGGPTAAIVLGAFFVAWAAFGVYNMAIDTIFLCFCVDTERGRLGQPMHCPPSLAELVRANPGKDADAPPAVKVVQGVPAEVSPPVSPHHITPDGITLAVPAGAQYVDRVSTRSSRGPFFSATRQLRAA